MIFETSHFPCYNIAIKGGKNMKNYITLGENDNIKISIEAIKFLDNSEFVQELKQMKYKKDETPINISECLETIIAGRNVIIDIKDGYLTLTHNGMAFKLDHVANTGYLNFIFNTENYMNIKFIFDRHERDLRDIIISAYENAEEYKYSGKRRDFEDFCIQSGRDKNLEIKRIIDEFYKNVGPIYEKANLNLNQPQ